MLSIWSRCLASQRPWRFHVPIRRGAILAQLALLLDLTGMRPGSSTQAPRELTLTPAADIRPWAQSSSSVGSPVTTTWGAPLVT